MRSEFHGKKSVRLEKEIPTQGGINSPSTREFFQAVSEGITVDTQVPGVMGDPL